MLKNVEKLALEISQIINDDMYHLLDEDDCKYLAEHLIDADYRKQSEGEWISVEERLPEPYTWVTVYNPNGKYTKIDADEIVGGNWVRNCGKVTHWMPLPEPPEANP